MDALAVVEIDVIINQFLCFGQCSNFGAVNALSLENGEEVFCQSIIITAENPTAFNK